MDEQSKKYLSQYILLSDKVTKAIMKHSKRYGIKAEICAWYSDMEDFFSDWCAIGYTRTQARKLFHGGVGEFQTLPEGEGIIRYSF